MINTYLLALGIVICLISGTMKIKWESSHAFRIEFFRYFMVGLIKVVPFYIGLLMIFWGLGF